MSSLPLPSRRALNRMFLENSLLDALELSRNISVVWLRGRFKLKTRSMMRFHGMLLSTPEGRQNALSKLPRSSSPDWITSCRRSEPLKHPLLLQPSCAVQDLYRFGGRKPRETLFMDNRPCQTVEACMPPGRHALNIRVSQRSSLRLLMTNDSLEWRCGSTTGWQ